MPSEFIASCILTDRVRMSPLFLAAQTAYRAVRYVYDECNNFFSRICRLRYKNECFEPWCMHTVNSYLYKGTILD